MQRDQRLEPDVHGESADLPVDHFAGRYQQVRVPIQGRFGVRPMERNVADEAVSQELDLDEFLDQGPVLPLRELVRHGENDMIGELRVLAPRRRQLLGREPLLPASIDPIYQRAMFSLGLLERAGPPRRRADLGPLDLRPEQPWSRIRFAHALGQIHLGEDEVGSLVSIPEIARR